MRIATELKTTWTRGLVIASATALLTGATFASLMLETDFMWALFDSYDELERVAEQRESEGNLAEAERLMRKIESSEARRLTHGFGWYAFFEGPTFVWRSKLSIARLVARQGRARDADAAYLDALAIINSSYEGLDGRRALGLFRYAQFLDSAGRRPEADDHLRQAEQIIATRLSAPASAGGALWREDEEAAFGPVYLRNLARSIDDFRNARVP